jgi:hypothetical protein
MKSFREFITEKKKEEAFPVSDADMKKLQRQARPETSSLSSERIRRGLDTARKPLSSDEIIGAWKSAKSAKPSVVATSSKPESGVYFGSSKKAIKTAQEQEKRQQVRDTIAKNPTASAELQAAQSSGPKETMVGKGAKSGTGEIYRANRPSETQATGVPSKKGRISGSVSKGNIKFSGDTKYKEMLAKMPNAPKKTPRVGAPVATTKVVKQAEVSKEIAQKTADYKTERGERAYRKTSADIEARRSFPTGKGGLKADEANPYVKREVRQARAAKLGGNVWDQPKGSSEPFKGQGKSPSKTTYPSFFKPTKPNITASRISKTAAPDRPATKQAVQFLKNLRRKSSSTSTPKNATTHGVGPDGKYLSPEMRKAVHKNRNVSAVVVHQPPKEKKKTGGGMVRKPSADALQRAVAGGNKPRLSKSPTQSQQPQLTAKSVGSEVSKSISKAQNRGRVGAGGVLSALGAAQEYKVGAARAKREGKGKLGQAFRGAARAAGAFAGGVAGTAIGGKVAGSVGAIGGGALGYSKGADFGSRAAKAVEKSSAAKWLAKTTKKYVPGLK